jgi:hypothetical protein
LRIDCQFPIFLAIFARFCLGALCGYAFDLLPEKHDRKERKGIPQTSPRKSRTDSLPASHDVA